MENTGLSHSRWAITTRLTSSEYRHLKGSISNPVLTPQPTSTPKSNPQTTPHLPPQQPPPPVQTASQKRLTTQTQDYSRFLKLLRRLKWKSSFLIHSHTRALLQQTDNVIGTHNFPITSDTGQPNAATIMFKADFFEFYALLERCLVHLLGCFGMVITATQHPNTNSNTNTRSVPVPPPLSAIDLNRSIHSNTTTSQTTLIGDSRGFHGYPHRFHANVLAALDTPSSPLHPTLGTGKTRTYLGISKEFRNRWKQVEREQDPSNKEDDFSGFHRSYARILEELRLEEMVAGILVGLDEARGVAGRYIAGEGLVDVDMVVGVDGEDEAFDESMGLDDAMDWD